MRKIDADRALERLRKKHDDRGTAGLDKFGILCAMKEIAEEPTVEAAKPGRWILHDVYCPETYECSVCGKRFVYDDHVGCDEWNFCPDCGAEMNCGNKKKKPELFRDDDVQQMIKNVYKKCLDANCEECPLVNDLDEGVCKVDLLMELWRRLQNKYERL